MRYVELAARTAGELQPTGQRWGLPHHLYRVTEQDVGLLLFGGRRIDLSARLLAGCHPINANTTSNRRLAVAFALFDVSPAKPAPAILALPAK